MDPSPFREKELPGYCFAGLGGRFIEMMTAESDQLAVYLKINLDAVVMANASLHVQDQPLLGGQSRNVPVVISSICT